MNWDVHWGLTGVLTHGHMFVGVAASVVIGVEIYVMSGGTALGDGLKGNQRKQLFWGSPTLEHAFGGMGVPLILRQTHTGTQTHALDLA